MTEDTPADQVGSDVPAPLPRFLDDQPCRDPEKMRFGHDIYVQAIRDAVASCPTPYTIGLYGKWGTGKTTVLEGLRATLHKQSHLGREFKVCLFDAWKYSQEASFRRQFLAELDRQLNLGWDLDELLYRPKEDVTLHWRALGRNLLTVFGVLALLCAVAFGVYWLASRAGAGALANTLLSAAVASVISIVLFVVGVVLDFVRISTYRVTHPLIFAPEQFEEQFGSMLIKAKVTDKRRLVVLIDNLDRCSAEAAVGALRTIKTFLEHEGCVFLVACDEAALIRHLSEERTHLDPDQANADADEFLRKLFQTTVDVKPLAADLRDFASDLVQAANLQADVARVLWAASPRDPRRIIQFLNRVVVSLYLVRAREQSGRLGPGEVSASQAYLAKILWLSERWRDFIDDCLIFPELMRAATEAIGRPDMIASDRVLNRYLGDAADATYPGLYNFLESTLDIQVEDPRPFLSLQRSVHEMNIEEPTAFQDMLRLGQVEHVRGQLSDLRDDARLQDYQAVMSRTIEDELTRRRRAEAIQVCRVAVGCIDLLVQPKGGIAANVCRTLTDPDSLEAIPQFRQSDLMTCVCEAPAAFRQRVALNIVRSLSIGSPHTAEFFETLSEHGAALSPDSWDELGAFLQSALQSAPDLGLRYLAAIGPGSSAASSLLGPRSDILVDVARGITLPDAEEATRMSNALAEYEEHMTTEVIDALTTSVISLLQAPPDQRVERYAQRALTALDMIEPADAPGERIDLLHHSLHVTAQEVATYEEKASFLAHELRICHRASEQPRQLSLQLVAEFARSWPPEQLRLLGDVVWGAGFELCISAFTTGVAERAADAQRSVEEIDKVLAAVARPTPDHRAIVLAEALAGMLASPERSKKAQAARNAAAYGDTFPRAMRDDLVQKLHSQYMALPPAEAAPLLGPLVELVDAQTPRDLRNSVADRLKGQMGHRERGIRGPAVQHYARLRSTLSQDTRKIVAQDVADHVYELRRELAADDRPLFDLLLEEQDNPRMIKATWHSLGNTLESLLHTDYPPEVRRMACQLIGQFRLLPQDLHDGIREQLETIAGDESLPQEIRDDASSAISRLDEAAE